MDVVIQGGCGGTSLVKNGYFVVVAPEVSCFNGDLRSLLMYPTEVVIIILVIFLMPNLILWYSLALFDFKEGVPT